LQSLQHSVSQAPRPELAAALEPCIDALIHPGRRCLSSSMGATSSRCSGVWVGAPHPVTVLELDRTGQPFLGLDIVALAWDLCNAPFQHHGLAQVHAVVTLHRSRQSLDSTVTPTQALLVTFCVARTSLSTLTHGPSRDEGPTLQALQGFP